MQVPPSPAQTKVASVPAEEERNTTYHVDTRSWRAVLGTHSWFMVHSAAAKYPEHPSEADKLTMIAFVGARLQFAGLLARHRAGRLGGTGRLHN